MREAIRHWWEADPVMQAEVVAAFVAANLPVPRVWCWVLPPMLPYVSARSPGAHGMVTMPLHKFDAAALVRAHA